jgi:hypothetical protein
VGVGKSRPAGLAISGSNDPHHARKRAICPIRPRCVWL